MSGHDFQDLPARRVYHPWLDIPEVTVRPGPSVCTQCGVSERAAGFFGWSCDDGASERTDTERLDWLENRRSFTVDVYIVRGVDDFVIDDAPEGFPTLRAAIDAAMDATKGDT